MKKIILASSSVRRKALLNQMGLTFEIIKPEIEDKLNPRLKPRGNAEQLSLAKAKAVVEKLKIARPHPDPLLKGEGSNSFSSPLRERNKVRGRGAKDEFVIIAADTFIVLDGEIIGKPEDKKIARKTLQKLSGRGHTVITGFTIMDTSSGKSVTKSVVTKVYFKKLSLKEIDSYIKTGEPMNKAGGYGMQDKGAIFVERVEGEPFNVVGLPLQTLTEELKKFGVKII